jgi:dihydroorotase
MASEISFVRPDDWHVHLRHGDALRKVISHTARDFARAIVMPNLTPPVTSLGALTAYRDEIIALRPEGSDFTPLMTLFLTDVTDPKTVEQAFTRGLAVACKLYPAHATTNSGSGVTSAAQIYPVLEVMQKLGMPLLLHGEATDPDVDIFDREAVFIDRVLTPMMQDFPELKIVFEHITTEEAAHMVAASNGRLAATVTPHHLMINRSDMFVGGLHPHLYCLPVAKRERHRQALRRAVTSGRPFFFLGTDSAPHPRVAKESACGCAGVFNAPTALACYLQVFEDMEALDRFEAFAAFHGPDFYGLARNKERVVWVRDPQIAPDAIDEFKVFRGGETLYWRRKADV